MKHVLHDGWPRIVAVHTYPDKETALRVSFAEPCLWGIHPEGQECWMCDQFYDRGEGASRRQRPAALAEGEGK